MVLIQELGERKRDILYTCWGEKPLYRPRMQAWTPCNEQCFILSINWHIVPQHKGSHQRCGRLSKTGAGLSGALRDNMKSMVANIYLHARHVWYSLTSPCKSRLVSSRRDLSILHDVGHIATSPRRGHDQEAIRTSSPSSSLKGLPYIYVL